MELNSQINTFTKGMNLDTDVTMIPEGQYRYAENIRLLTDADGTTGMLQNIEYIRQYDKGNALEGEAILGTATARLYKADGNGTYECGIVFTIKNNVNYLYKVTGFESTKLTFETITKGNLGITNNVSIVTNYESDRVSNVYICDGNTPIKVINIYDDNLKDKEEEDGIKNITDSTYFDITPGCVLLPFRFQTTIAGSLPAGSIQYCYQLFNLNGPETTTSALSEVIPITMHDEYNSTAKIKGQLKGELSNNGCRIVAKFKNDGRFNRARIFSIVYLDNISVPDIYIINEVEIPTTKDEFNEFIYDDTGSSFVSKITIDEFNQLVPFEFNAKCVAQMQNRLFAANIQELTWDIPEDYDTRAYRCNKNGVIVLNSSDTSKTIEGVLENGFIFGKDGVKIEVPKEHDCINPSNINVFNPAEYIYASKNATFQGGCGPQISYRFVYTELINSNERSLDEGELVYNLKLDGNYTTSVIWTFYEDGKTLVNEKGNIFNKDNGALNFNGKNVFANYADPYICSNYTGYKRDEIYRFGIIFYNNKNIPSPVHWIADIRMPSVHDANNKNSVIYPFHTGKEIYSGDLKELVSYALGIEFKLNNMPDGAYSYEIVRCDRNETNRTIVTQGIAGALHKFDSWEDSDKGWHIGENDIRPAPMFNIASDFRTRIIHGGSLTLCPPRPVSIGYMEFVSPEICIMKDSIENSLKNSVIYRLYNVNSRFNNGPVVHVPQYGGIYTVSENDKQTNDDQFGHIQEFEGDDNSTFLHMGHGYKEEKWNGFAGVFKYYNIDEQNVTNVNINDVIISTILPYRIDLDVAKSYAQYIGNKTYVNLSIGGDRQFSNHGISAVLNVDDSFNPYNDVRKNSTAFCTGIIADIKRNTSPYSGSTYINRQNSIYTSCSCFSDISNDTVYCYGGDTYLGVLDYLNTSVIQQDNDPNEYSENRLCCVCYIPLESSVNLNLRSDDSYHRTVSGDGRTAQNLVQNEPAALANGYTQKKPYYEYNPVYSTTSGSKQYVSKGIYSVDNQVNQTRIVTSELKTNNEITDSWTKFKFANYIDVDSQYGQITNLKVFNNKLFYWQDNAVGVASVNERSLITDNNMAELTLGTGGILARFDYVATLNGSSIVNDKSITNSATTIYWYDFDKNEICMLGNGVTPLSKLKGVQSYLNTLSNTSKKNAVSFYDKKYNEVWFRIYNKALIYNEQLSVFTSFYTHDPNWFFPFSDKLVTIKNNNMYYLHNIYEVNSDTKEERIAKVQFVVNKDISNTKVFDNVVFSADLLDNDNETPNIVKDVVFKTKTQETNPIDFNSIELREDNYRFPISREKTSDEALNKISSQSYLGRMRGKYLICDYTFDCNNNREFKLPYIKTTYRYSML